MARDDHLAIDERLFHDIGKCPLFIEVYTTEVDIGQRLMRADRLMKASGVGSEALLEEWLLGLMVNARAAA